MPPPGFLLAACGLQTVPGGFHPYGAGLLVICNATRGKALHLCAPLLEIERNYVLKRRCGPGAEPMLKDTAEVLEKRALEGDGWERRPSKSSAA